MPEVRISIGGRSFDVACQDGEEHYLQSAAALLDAEASVLVNQIGRMPEPRMLLMAGLMLADKTAGMTDRIKRLEQELGEQRARLEQMDEGRPVPVAPEPASAAVDPALEDAVARAEAIADAIEAKLTAA